MSLEGRLRELGLPDVLQLLGLSRKSGTLQLRAQLQGAAAFVRLAQGAIVDAASWRLHEGERAEDAPGLATSSAATRAVEACVLDLLTWRDGEFRFVPIETPPPVSPVRLTVDMLLVEAAQRAENWERLADRIAHAHVVPAFVDVEPQQLPLLRLVPQEWEILTRVDGKRDLAELATVLGRELLDVAGIVHGLIGAGLLTLREVQTAPRRNPTPPIGSDVLSPRAGGSAASHARDLWIPHGDDALTTAGDVHGDDDTLFDPIQMGVLTADGMPRRRTTPRGMPALSTPAEMRTDDTVASSVAETSLHRGEASWPLPGMDATTLCTHGDEAARRGDLAGALTFWSAALRSEASLADADRIREAIALAARLHALLHPAARRE
ncbi:MAG: DUF4388 domain-containing protein [Gemmatimonadaceae bacterium]|nr:DUF4388 domain-containing protein [Gemmatimonadaceae bacterium]